MSVCCSKIKHNWSNTLLEPKRDISKLQNSSKKNKVKGEKMYTHTPPILHF